MAILWWFYGDWMGFNDDLMVILWWFYGDWMGFNGDFMGFDEIYDGLPSDNSTEWKTNLPSPMNGRVAMLIYWKVHRTTTWDCQPIYEYVWRLGGTTHQWFLDIFSATIPPLRAIQGGNLTAGSVHKLMDPSLSTSLTLRDINVIGRIGKILIKLYHVLVLHGKRRRRSGMIHHDLSWSLRKQIIFSFRIGDWDIYGPGFTQKNMWCSLMCISSFILSRVIYIDEHLLTIYIDLLHEGNHINVTVYCCLHNTHWTIRVNTFSDYVKTTNIGIDTASKWKKTLGSKQKYMLTHPHITTMICFFTCFFHYALFTEMNVFTGCYRFPASWCFPCSPTNCSCCLRNTGGAASRDGTSDEI